MTDTNTDRMLQYGSSTDPEIVAAIERNTAGRLEFIARVNVFVREHGGSKWSPGGLFGAHHILAMHRDDDRKPEGWVNGPSRIGGLRPRKNTDLWREWDTLEFHEEPVPGLPQSVEGPTNADGSFRVMWPVRFTLDGVAWAGLSSAPVLDQRGSHEACWGNEWTEVKGSEFLRALEIYNDRLDQESNDG